MREYKRLLRFFRPHLALFAFASVCMSVSALFDGVSLSMIMPLADKVLTNKQIVLPVKLPPALAGVIDTLNNVPPLELLKFLSFGIIMLFVLKGIFAFLQGYLMSDISQRVIRDLRARLYEKFHSLSLDYFTHRRGGEMMSRVTNDVSAIGYALSYAMTDLIYQSLQVVVFAFLIFFIHAQLALISLVLIPVISIPMIKVGRVLKKISRLSQERMADLNSILYETIIGVRVVKAFNMEAAEQKKFDAVNEDTYRLSMKSVKRTQLLSPFTELVGIIAGVGVLFWGGKEVIAGRISFGVMGFFLAALLSLVRPFKKLSQVNAIVQQAVAASVRIYEVLDTVPTVKEKPGAQELQGFKDTIVYDSVRFSYGQHEVLKGISLQVQHGEVVAVVGPSGSGKTTLLDLLPRFYDPSSGRITVDGKDIRDLSFASLRRNIAIVTQETILFNDTIANNIAYGKSHAERSAIEHAARQAHIHEVIMRQKSGYDTAIGDRGTKLSGGERQRIAIARAILKDAPILILDEATSQLDTESERLVQEALNELMKGRTVLVIAHRLSTIRHANRILVMDSGSIVQQGSHDELIAQEGLYKKLYQNQQIHK